MYSLQRRREKPFMAVKGRQYAKRTGACGLVAFDEKLYFSYFSSMSDHRQAT